YLHSFKLGFIGDANIGFVVNVSASDNLANLNIFKLNLIRHLNLTASSFSRDFDCLNVCLRHRLESQILCRGYVQSEEERAIRAAQLLAPGGCGSVKREQTLVVTTHTFRQTLRQFLGLRKS